MSLKRVSSNVLVLVLLGLGAARGQYDLPPTGSAPTMMATTPLSEGSATQPPEEPGRLSDWIQYRRACDCCGPVGGNGPIGTELYTRAGMNSPFGGSFFDKTLQVGWTVQAGGRVLFFNPEHDAAWTVDLGVAHFHNHGRNPFVFSVLRNVIVPTQAAPGQFAGATRIPQLPVTIMSLDRTFGNIGLGREWFFLNGRPAECGSCAGSCWENMTLRAGVDIGGRMGGCKLELNELRHRSGTLGAFYTAVHATGEVPWGCCIFSTGLRCEYDYTFIDVLQEQNEIDFQSINVLLSFAVRY